MNKDHMGDKYVEANIVRMSIKLQSSGSTTSCQNWIKEQTSNLKNRTNQIIILNEIFSPFDKHHILHVPHKPDREGPVHQIYPRHFFLNEEKDGVVQNKI